MTDKITVKLTGNTAVVVFHQLMRPGEQRELHPSQVHQLEDLYPGRFERIGVQLDEQPAQGPQFEIDTSERFRVQAKPDLTVDGDLVVKGSITAEPEHEPVQAVVKRGSTKKKKS